MLLYHGSNVPVEHPRIIKPVRKLDFGPGFYLTSSRDQAAAWATRTRDRNKSGSATLSIFEFDESALQRLQVLAFPEANEEWLRYTAGNRMNEDAHDFYDVVIGPVANDQTFPVIAGYYAGIYTESEAIRRLLPQKLKDQYAFKTEEALRHLHLKEVLTL